MVNNEKMGKEFQQEKGRVGKARCAGRCDIELGDVTKHNVMQLKRLNMSVFPVIYNEKFYKELVNAGELAKLAYFNDIIVGGVCCRVEIVDGVKKLYIMTLGTLAPYRRYGVGSLLLWHVFTLCQKDQQVKGVYLHVQTNNESALNFYKHFGFEVSGKTEKYYKKIEPGDAFILERKMNQQQGEQEERMMMEKLAKEVGQLALTLNSPP